MKRAIRATLLTAWALMSLSAAFSQEYTLKLNVKEGDVFKYKMTMDIDFGGQNVTVTMPITNKVLKIEESGNIVMESAAGEMLIKFGDQEMPQPAPPASKITYKPNGAIEKAESAQGGLPANNFNAAFPDKPVKVGDKWSHTIKGQNGAPDIVNTLELVGVEKLGEAEVLKIKVTLRTADTKESEGFSGDGFNWIDPKTGMLVKSEISVKGMVAEGAPMPLNGIIKMERIP
ncbi:MAG: hypothetical protein CFK49_02095 [Armatimonadetes bacterium JP3_11]|jgi:hypothetical protein|nr:MAG: hypothetical protein CFK48_01785 [Armatimonadetes bacterium CP1_7O]OYT75641.1 MAG: hypothetical protein CFK49_02095 [Armatimonadetes bacterium JP3_11]RMH08571.1 MAG: hypothetical protein D6697_05750 [Armatimonadota bacterium]